MADRPLFIVFEGTDGAGTTTQGHQLAEHLRAEGKTVVRTAEPSEGPIGQLLRQVLRAPPGERMDPQAVALLFAADRVDHVARLIDPALQRGEWVVCDRYLGSSLAFQVVDGQGAIDAPWVLQINRTARVPDLTILLDLPSEVAVQRIEQRGQPRERFEVQATLERVRARYLEVLGNPPERLGPVVVVDAGRTPAEVGYDVRAAVEARRAQNR